MSVNKNIVLAHMDMSLNELPEIQIGNDYPVLKLFFKNNIEPQK